MKILISNDDGYLAPGIQALASAMSRIAKVVVVAPERNRSGASNALTLDKPLSVTKVNDECYFVDGTPSDCVHIALTGMLDFVPDLVVSGINQGQNMGDDTLYSCTVAAATEGYLFGINSIAFSQAHKGWIHLDAAAEIALDIVQRALEQFNQTTSPVLLNVNIPNLPTAQIQGVQVTRLGKRHQSEPVIKSLDPRGNPIYWIGASGQAKEAGIGTDFYAIEQNMVSITPLQVDLTHFEQMAHFKQVWK